MITISCDCGWSAQEPSKIQADVTFDQHRRRGCLLYSTCMICLEIGPGKLRPPEVEGGPIEFICERCWSEHPREGNYHFDSSSIPSKALAMGGRAKGKRQ